MASAEQLSALSHSINLSHRQETPETHTQVFLFVCFQGSISQLEAGVKSHDSAGEVMILDTVETCVFDHVLELLLQEKHQHCEAVMLNENLL